MSVTIENCDNKKVSHLIASKLVIINSDVNFSQLSINTNDSYAMTIMKSNVEVWGGKLTGLSTAYLENSELELNGVDLYSKNALVISNIPSTINASLTDTNVNGVTSHWHGIINVGF